MTNGRVPVITGNYSPFRLVLRDNDTWDPGIERLNQRSYDYVKLHRASCFVDVGIAPFSLVVCFDGTLALPAVEEYRDPQRALGLFNTVLSKVLVGGVYCEAMSPTDLCLGSLSFDAYCRISGASRGAVSGLHKALRMKHAGAQDVIRLLRPETVKVGDLQSAFARGHRLLDGLGIDLAETLLHGTTFFVRNLWAESLLHFWMTIEQIIGALWRESIVDDSSVDGITTARRKSFLSDHRTWTASTMCEVLYQKSILPGGLYGLLDRTRATRNAFIHRGVEVTRTDAETALEASFELVTLRVGSAAENDVLPMVSIVKQQSQLFERWDGSEGPLTGVTHWLELPPLPGDPGWGDRPYEVVDELCLKPID